MSQEHAVTLRDETSQDGAATTDSAVTVVAGWYADPHVADQRRYWDGVSWTDDRAPLVPETPGPPNAPPLKRIVGRLIDRSILAIGGPIFQAGAIAGSFADEISDVVNFAYGICLILTWVVLDTLFVGKLGATPGKLLLGLTVVDVTTGDAPSYGQALGRAALGIVPGLMFGLGVIGLAGFAFAGPILMLVWLVIGIASLIMLFTSSSRTVHDRLGGTKVIERQPLKNET